MKRNKITRNKKNYIINKMYVYGTLYTCIDLTKYILLGFVTYILNRYMPRVKRMIYFDNYASSM